MLKAWLSKGAAILFLVLVAAYPAYQLIFPYLSSKEKFEPSLQSDLLGKYVAVQPSEKSEDLRVWVFSQTDQAQLKQLDIQIDGRKRYVYADVTARSEDGYRLSGVLEAHYIKIADKSYLIGLASINLQIDDPPQSKKPKQDKPQPKSNGDVKEPEKTDKDADKSTTGNAQPFPGDK